MPKTDIDGYPTICAICEKPIIKSRHDSQQLFDHETNTATSWHTTCSQSSHPFYCQGQPASIQMVLGSWFCTVCGIQVNWVVT